MTKIYKAIKTSELGQYTSDGWTWDGAERREQQVIEIRDNMGRVMTPAEREAGGYRDAYNAPRLYDHKHFFGDVLIFIVWKDKEQISREEAAESRAFTAEHQLTKVTAETVQLAKQIETLTKERDTAKELAAANQRSVHASYDKNRKLEGDIAKIRLAIGEKQMREILGTPTS